MVRRLSAAFASFFDIPQDLSWRAFNNLLGLFAWQRLLSDHFYALFQQTLIDFIRYPFRSRYSDEKGTSQGGESKADHRSCARIRQLNGCTRSVERPGGEGSEGANENV